MHARTVLLKRTAVASGDLKQYRAMANNRDIRIGDIKGRGKAECSD
jgi:hypothetical protein